ncbi:unnamed protein product [Lathyrus oleraceus]|uniref:U1-type domain-containing protein n=1 Tax=Pisum sativum TaxID=3888 RepID=A0A9D4X6X3_PEA|nr:uncharacterized protein LOC127138446 [Pisum sativum]KAI5414747.1 hypothetical protein KIW84_040277 [Pisum sativum]
MEFKFRAVDNKEPPTTSLHSLPDRSLQMEGSFSGFRMPLSGEAALRREIEKELIRREILRRSELEEEVRRELAMEKEFGISIQRPLMSIQGLMSHWSNSSVMNPAAEPPSILPPAEINPSPEISDKGKVIVLAKPDPNLFNAKRKATTPLVSEIEPLAFSSKKKSKEEWSCALCEIKATSESGLNAHLNGKKHKAREARQNRKIAKRNKKSRDNVMVAETDVTTTKLLVDAEKDQQLLQPCTTLEVMNETAVDKGVEESKREEQLAKTVADNDASATESKNEKFVAMMVGKNEEQLGETVADNGGSVIKSTNEDKLVEMMIGNDIIKFENGGLVAEKSQNVGSLESKRDAAMDEAEKISALTKRRKVEPLWCEICEISTFSKAVMEGHVKGKKHIKKMNKFGQNNVSPPSTSSVSQKAPPMLIKDA